jgi:hypothetical protein
VVPILVGLEAVQFGQGLGIIETISFEIRRKSCQIVSVMIHNMPIAGASLTVSGAARSPQARMRV